MTVVSLTDYTPLPRFDGLPWTNARLEEGPADAGPWTPLHTFPLSPLDADPSNPITRSFTWPAATLVEGWYRIVWVDAALAESPTDPVHNIESSKAEYMPTTSQVARLILSRTKDRYGNMPGSFTALTTPTALQVTAIANDVIPEVADVIGDTVPEALTDDAQQVVALRTAMQIELSYYSDQVNTGRSIYPQLKEQYTLALAELAKQIEMFGQDGATTVGEGAPSLSPAFSFPQPTTDWLSRRM